MTDDALRARRLRRYQRRAAATAKPKTRASDVAPRRIGDGIKPNHRARAVSLDAAFPLAPKTEPVRVDGHVVGQRVVSS